MQLSVHSHMDSIDIALLSVEKSFSRNKGKLREIALKLHQYRELAFEERKSATLLSDFLEKEGFIVERGIAGLETAFVATFISCNPKPTDPVVSFNAEYDALPEIGHACGHNLIAAGSVGAALATKDWLQTHNVAGTLKLFGTPGEEGTGGKINLINAGYYKDVDISLMSHPSLFDGCFLPTVACNSFDVEFFGKSAHASIAPWEGINALDAMIQTFNSLNALRQLIRPFMKITGIILEGGKYDNLIPDYTKGGFCIRAANVDDLMELKNKVVQRIQGAALTTGCRFAITETMTYKDLRPNTPLALRYQAYATELGIRFPSRTEQENLAASASTDQGNVSYEVPSIQAVYKIDTPSGAANHTPEFDKAAKSEEAFEKTILSAKALSQVAIDFFAQSDFQEDVKGNFRGGGKGETLS